MSEGSRPRGVTTRMFPYPTPLTIAAAPRDRATSGNPAYLAAVSAATRWPAARRIAPCRRDRDRGGTCSKRMGRRRLRRRRAAPLLQRAGAAHGPAQVPAAVDVARATPPVDEDGTPPATAATRGTAAAMRGRGPRARPTLPRRQRRSHDAARRGEGRDAALPRRRLAAAARGRGPRARPPSFCRRRRRSRDAARR